MAVSEPDIDKLIKSLTDHLNEARDSFLAKLQTELTPLVKPSTTPPFTFTGHDYQKENEGLRAEITSLEMKLEFERSQKEMLRIKLREYKLHNSESKDISHLQREIKILKPLADVGRATRARFIEHAKDSTPALKSMRKNEEIIRLGNEAAHGGNLKADLALIHLDTLDEKWTGDTRKVFEALYGLKIDTDKTFPSPHALIRKGINCIATVMTVNPTSSRNRVDVALCKPFFMVKQNKFHEMVTKLEQSWLSVKEEDVEGIYSNGKLVELVAELDVLSRDITKKARRGN